MRSWHREFYYLTMVQFFSAHVQAQLAGAALSAGHSIEDRCQQTLQVTNSTREEVIARQERDAQSIIERQAVRAHERANAIPLYTRCKTNKKNSKATLKGIASRLRE